MDWNAIATWGVPALGGAAMWLWRQLTRLDDKHNTLGNELQTFKLQAAEKYVPHTRFDETVREISRKLDTIIDAMGKKADRE